jgi:hypothetical protein
MLVHFNSEANLYIAWHWCVLMDPANHLKDGLKIHKMVHDPLKADSHAACRSAAVPCR